MFKSFPRSRESNKVTPWGSWVDEGHSAVEGFSLALCDVGLEWRGNTDYCIAPDPVHLLEMAARGQTFSSHFKWGPEIKKKVIFSNPPNSQVCLKESNVQLSGTLLQPFLAPIKLPMSGWIRAYCKFMGEKNLRIRSEKKKTQKSSFELGLLLYKAVFLHADTKAVKFCNIDY